MSASHGAAGCVTLTTGAPIAKGAEIFISYGRRPNEELLYSHGFCVRDNPMDDVTLVLAADGGDAAAEPYRIRRQAAGGIPSELLRAAAAAAARLGEEGEEGEGGDQADGLPSLAPMLDAPLEVGHAYACT